MIKFKIKEGYPKLNVIHNGKKYNLATLKELPDDVFKYAMKEKRFGITKEKTYVKRGSE